MRLETNRAGLAQRAQQHRIVPLRVQGTDSCVAAFEAPQCSYTVDRGAFSGALESSQAEPGYSRTSTTIDGWASVVSYGPVSMPSPNVFGRRVGGDAIRAPVVAADGGRR